eukprot:Blabericola_migrator_1__7428@NODE_3788_length_1510_cov_11_405405_g2350_i0_p2_GENE_NODE_3788_length_1510_cov_11_405405_g2350_i0NODE_3788_length_1510_cov_11_405405_g2350_i0_p2_ORF_typecomplete_len210_score22_89RVP_2/PF08284_11/8_4e17Peptidase_A2B/PF12384_8/4_2e16Peptidase_A2B/PF12384_8/2_4e03gagasp_proteas/PF13975_6/2e14gagasp_proteas/PF13975_6/2_7e03Asp_protease/PF09668_10/4_3e12RVP/PF00077_20/2_1e11RVP/PF00077_20/3_1e03Asp_protease_2/PF13650_6/1_4e09Asp_protease_2/PF13650_6/1e04Peptidase_A3/PF02
MTNVFVNKGERKKIHLTRKGNAYYLPMMCKNRKIHALIDTGATHSVISKELAGELQLKVKAIPKMNLKTAAQKAFLQLQGLVTIPMSIEDKSKNLDLFVVKDLREECILGMTQLKSLEAHLDIPKETLTICTLQTNKRIKPIMIDTGEAKPQKDQGMRVPQHYLKAYKEEQSLNKVTKRDSYPIPRIDDILDTLQPFTYFAKIDPLRTI